MTSVTEVRRASARLFAGTWRPLVSVITTLYDAAIIFHRRMASRAFSALCVHSKFGDHPHLLGYLSAKFCFFRGLHCWASPWRKIAYSISHSSSLFDALETEALALRNIGRQCTWKWYIAFVEIYYLKHKCQVEVTTRLRYWQGNGLAIAGRGFESWLGNIV